MARCTAPVRGHRTASGRAECPACGGSYRWGGYGGYGYGSSYTPPSYSSPSYPSSGSSGGGRSSGGGSSRSTKPRWSGAGSSQFYTPEEVRALMPIRETVERRASMPDLRHIFLCHAWDDRQGVAKELCDLLVARDVSVWFSEKDRHLRAGVIKVVPSTARPKLCSSLPL